MSDNPHVMSKYATELDCLRARDKWHQERIATLEAENAELRKDAERYRWLRDRPLDPHFLDGWYVIQVTGDGGHEIAKCRNLEDLDAAIDAAMKENGNG